MHREECALRIEVEGFVEVGFSSHSKRCDFAPAGIREKYVDVPVLLFHNGIKPVQILKAGDVACDRRDVLANKGCGLTQRFLAPSSDDNMSAFLHEAFRAG